MAADDEVNMPEDARTGKEDAPATAGQAATGAGSARQEPPTSTTDDAAALRAELAALKERVARLERDVEAERSSGTDYMHKMQQAQADLANFRRRAQKDAEQFAELAAAQAMALVLPALDSFERAFKTLPESLRSLTWIEGIALVESQLHHTLQLHGVESFEPKPGDTLDLARHQAIAHAETTAHPEGSVVEVVQRGYALHGRALRPALVRVARPPATSDTGASGPAHPADAPAANDTDKDAPSASGPAPPEPSP